MSAQVTVRIPDELARLLATKSRRSGMTTSEIVRRALEEHLEVSGAGRVAERVRDLFGSLESGVPDLAERDREAIVEAIRRGR